MNGKKFFAQLPKGFTYEDRNKIEWAYDFAKREHGEQMRDEGERYFNHPRRVALYFLKYKQSLVYGSPVVLPEHIIAALLHDVVEDCWSPEGMIRRLFGEEVEKWVFGLSKKIPLFDKTSGYITRKKKIDTRKYLKNLVKTGTDVECIIKMCDRLDNVRTMSKAWTSKEQFEYIEETKLMLKIFGRFYDTTIYLDLEKEVVKTLKRLK